MKRFKVSNIFGSRCKKMRNYLTEECGVHHHNWSCKPVASGGPGGGACTPLPVFGRQVYLISTRGAHYPHQVLRSPLDFQTLRRPWSSWIGWFRIIQPNSDLLHLVPLYAATKIEMSASTPWPIMINIAQKGIDFQFQFCLISFPEQFCY